MKNKGFTLIELLAVIIILGILMIIAIPAVTSYISQSRKSAYIDTAKEMISGARNLVNSGKLSVYDQDITYYIPVSCIPSETGSKSPYGEFDPAYVVVTYNGDGFKYYWISTDTSQTGIPTLTSYDDLDADDIQTSISKEMIKTDKGLNGASITRLYSNNCKSYVDSEAKANLERYVTNLAKTDNTNLKVDVHGNVRYIGNNPKNYVKFSDSNKIWRIIGVVDRKIKAYDKEKYGNYSLTFVSHYYNASILHNDIDDWPNSVVQKDLNTTYYDSLSDKTKDAIVEATWCIEDSHNNRLTIEEIYQKERACSSNVEKQWVGKVASIYVSDFYLSLTDDCDSSGESSYSTVHQWLYPGIQSSKWRFNSISGAAEDCLLPMNGGWIGSGPGSGRKYVLPTVYFSSDLYVKSGTGTSSDPYIVEKE